ncbi:MAG: hypothetical protein WA476_17615 [Acidobacteriaceae bacterium]
MQIDDADGLIAIVHRIETSHDRIDGECTGDFADRNPADGVRFLVERDYFGGSGMAQIERTGGFVQQHAPDVSADGHLDHRPRDSVNDANVRVFVRREKDRIRSRIDRDAIRITNPERLRGIRRAIDRRNCASVSVRHIDLVCALIHSEGIRQAVAGDRGDDHIVSAIDHADRAAAIVGNVDAVGEAIHSEGYGFTADGDNVRGAGGGIDDRDGICPFVDCIDPVGGRIPGNGSAGDETPPRGVPGRGPDGNRAGKPKGGKQDRDP